jgi:hypothetical protein
MFCRHTRKELMLIVQPCDLFQSQGMQKTYSFQGISWHKHRHWVAFVGGQDQVLVHDFEDAGRILILDYEPLPKH